MGHAQHSTWQAGSTQKVSFPGESFCGPSQFLLALSLVPDRLGLPQPPRLPPSPIRALSAKPSYALWGGDTGSSECWQASKVLLLPSPLPACREQGRGGDHPGDPVGSVAVMAWPVGL